MKRKSLTKLQIAAASIHFAAVVLCLALIVFQKSIRPLYTDDPEVLGADTIFPSALFLRILFALVISAIFLLFSRRIRSSSQSSLLVIILLIVFYTINMFVFPDRMISDMEHAYKQSTIFGVAYSIIANSISLLATPLSAVGTVLLMIAMGGFIGCDPKKEHGSATPFGAALLQTLSVLLFAVANVICWNVIINQDRIKIEESFGLDLIGLNVIPWEIVIPILLITGIAVVFLILVWVRKAKRRGGVNTTIFAVFMCLIPFIYPIAGLLVPNNLKDYGNSYIAAYSLVEGWVVRRTMAWTEIAAFLMCLSLGACRGKNAGDDQESTPGLVE